MTTKVTKRSKRVGSGSHFIHSGTSPTSKPQKRGARSSRYPLSVFALNALVQAAHGSTINEASEPLSALINFSTWLCSVNNEAALRSLTNEWLDTVEAAEYLGIPVGTLRNLTSNGKVPHYKVPGTRSNRYRRSELQELLLSSRRGGSYVN